MRGRGDALKEQLVRATIAGIETVWDGAPFFIAFLLHLSSGSWLTAHC